MTQRDRRIHLWTPSPNFQTDMISHNWWCVQRHHYFNLCLCKWFWTMSVSTSALHVIVLFLSPLDISANKRFIQISRRQTWTPETGVNVDAFGQFPNKQLHFDTYHQMLKRRTWKHQQLNDLAVQRLGTPNSKLSVFLLIRSVSPSLSLCLLSQCSALALPMNHPPL